MSKKQILRAISKKGLSLEVCEYNFQPTPHGNMPGWDIELDEQSIDLALDHGCDIYDLEPDCENTMEVLEWIASLPDCTPARTGEHQ